MSGEPQARGLAAESVISGAQEWKTTEKERPAVGRGNCELCCPVLSGCE
jgi:hypothetical protein